MWVRNNKGNVFVGNLPPDFSDERLAETFDPFGIVLSAIVARDPETGARLRYGFVDIATERAATEAIAALHGSAIDGCKLNVKPRDKPAKKPGSGPRRPPMRGGGANGASAAVKRDFAEAPRPSQSQRAQEKMAETRQAIEALPEIEPPPRRDFEVVRRPIRRVAPSFQVERRSLPRRGP